MERGVQKLGAVSPCRLLVVDGSILKKQVGKRKSWSHVASFWRQEDFKYNPRTNGTNK